MTRRTPAERFWALTDRSGDGCWIWSSSVDRDGYGKFRLNGKTVVAHRFAYSLVHGEAPAGMDLDHLCRTPACVRPDHLEAVSHRTNVLRGTGAAARNAAKTHCNHGHEFTPKNTYEWNGWRICRTCRRATVARYQARRRAAA